MASILSRFRWKLIFWSAQRERAGNERRGSRPHKNRALCKLMVEMDREIARGQ